MRPKAARAPCRPGAGRLSALSDSLFLSIAELGARLSRAQALAGARRRDRRWSGSRRSTAAQRLHHLAGEGGSGPGRRGRARARRGHRSRPAPWRAGGDQGSDRHGGRADDLRLTAGSPQTPDRGCAAGRAAEGGRGRDHRQDQSAGIRLWRGPSRLRPDQQSLGSRAHLRRLQRRLRSSSRRRPLLRGTSAPIPAARSASPPPIAASSG